MRGLNLASDDDALVIERGGTGLTRADLEHRSEGLLRLIAQHDVQRALVRSDHPEDILCALDACGRSSVDLYVAHTALSCGHVDEILDGHGIDLVLGREGVLRPSTSRTRGEGRVFMMTSGTTGRPKIAAHTLPSLLSKATSWSNGSEQTGGKWLLTYQPTGFAGVQVMLTAVQTRGVIVVAPERTPSAFHEAAARAKVTSISATPTFWRSLLMVARPGELALRQVTLGGEAVDQIILDRLRRTFPDARITHTYASTEAGLVYAVHDGKAGFPSAWLDDPQRPIQLRARDGFLQIKSARAMTRYASESAQPFEDDGWLATADRCRIEGDRAFITGRDDSTINVAGSKVYPFEVETFLLGLPGVAEVAVYGVPNPVSGALVAADVVLETDQDPVSSRTAILTACRATLAGYQVPRVLRVVDAIRVNASGKKG